MTWNQVSLLAVLGELGSQSERNMSRVLDFPRLAAFVRTREQSPVPAASALLS